MDNLAPKKIYRCPKHGDQGRVIGVAVEVTMENGEHFSRRYCMKCWIAWMDDNMLPLAEIEANGSPSAGGE